MALVEKLRSKAFCAPYLCSSSSFVLEFWTLDGVISPFSRALVAEKYDHTLRGTQTQTETQTQKQMETKKQTQALSLMGLMVTARPTDRRTCRQTDRQADAQSLTASGQCES